ncbi:MAG: hypothetical protein HQK66_11310 [Desulfamplus sp.]|nr:hypothetical protein [Desulfamplus sp.]
MKIVNADTIQASEKEFIDNINAELDWVSIEKMILEKHKLQLQEEVLYKQGDIVVHNNQVAYRLDFDITLSMSLTFNRDGECLDIETPDALLEDEEGTSKKDEDIDLTKTAGLVPETDSLKKDSLETDSLKKDSLETDSLKKDLLETDSLKKDLLETDSSVEKIASGQNIEEGEKISPMGGRDEFATEDEDEDEDDFADDSAGGTGEEHELPENRNWSKMAPGLADMITDINQDSR